MARVGADVDQWERLGIYRQRYSIEDRLGPLLSLEKSMSRRRVRSASLARRLDELKEQMTAVRAELRAVDSELAGSRATGALLIEEILDQVQIEMGEAWSPTPVHGFRVWRIDGNRVMGNQTQWESPTMVSECLREISGEDLPHPISRCGPPACGIYAVKNLDSFPPDVAGGVFHNSIVGIVAMSGKVVEHDDGYRSQKATAIAVSANDGTRRLVTAHPGDIKALFDDPIGALANAEPRRVSDEPSTREFLESIKSKEEQWT